MGVGRRLRSLRDDIIRFERRTLYGLKFPLPDSKRLRVVCGGALHKMALVAPDLSFAYVVVPKAANTTVRRVLWAARGAAPEAQDVQAELHAGPGPYRSFADLSSRELRHVLRSPEVFRFTFVRNPYARLASAYRDKVLNLGGASPGYDTGLDFDPAAHPSFAAFVRKVAGQADEYADWHWRSQFRCAATEMVDYGLVGRVETFEADMALVLRRIGAEPDLAAAAPPMNRTSDAPGIAVYDHDLAEIVHRRYRQDFELFGYDPESYRRIA